MLLIKLSLARSIEYLMFYKWVELEILFLVLFKINFSPTLEILHKES